MTILTMPVIRLRFPDDLERAMAALLTQQFEPCREGDADLSVTLAEDLDEAFLVLQADGFACEVARGEVRRLGAPRPSPLVP